MHIIIGTQDPEIPVIVRGVTERFIEIDQIDAIDTDADVKEIAVGFDQLVTDAANVARGAWRVGVDIGIGIIEGLGKVHFDSEHYILTSAACIFDGEDIFTGLGVSIELPGHLAEEILQRCNRISDVLAKKEALFPEMDWTQYDSPLHLSNILTKNHLSYQEFIQGGFEAALLQYLNRGMYQE